MALLLGAAALSFAGGAMGAIGGYQDASAQAKEMERAARMARKRGLEDYNISSQQLSLQEQEAREQATMAAHQSELQQQDLAAQSLMEGGAAAVQHAGRGVGGAGTARSMVQGVKSMGRQQEGFTLQRDASFNSHARGMKAAALQRQSLGTQLDRLGEDTRMQEKQASSMEQSAWKNMWMGIGGAAINTGMQAGIGGFESGVGNVTAGPSEPSTLSMGDVAQNLSNAGTSAGTSAGRQPVNFRQRLGNLADRRDELFPGVR